MYAAAGNRLSRRLWEQAQFYADWIARLPFVRMVALTGSLAAGNAEDGADIDYLIVTEPGRLWSCRASILGVVYWAARRGVRLCPNYLLSENALALKDRSPYAARELVQMAPLYGLDTFYQMRTANPWVETYLPNAWGFSQPAGSALRGRPIGPHFTSPAALQAVRRMGAAHAAWWVARKLGNAPQAGSLQPPARRSPRERFWAGLVQRPL